MQITLGDAKYESDGVFGFVGAVLMLPAVLLAFVAAIVAFILIIPGGGIAMLGARRIN
jgi:hypothetical protein